MTYGIRETHYRLEEAAGGAKAFSVQVRRQIAEKGKDLFIRYGIEKVVLFGSIEKGRGEPGSDVDLYAAPLPAEQYWRFRRELEEAVDMSYFDPC